MTQKIVVDAVGVAEETSILGGLDILRPVVNEQDCGGIAEIGRQAVVNGRRRLFQPKLKRKIGAAEVPKDCVTVGKIAPMQIIRVAANVAVNTLAEVVLDKFGHLGLQTEMAGPRCKPICRRGIAAIDIDEPLEKPIAAQRAGTDARGADLPDQVRGGGRASQQRTQRRQHLVVVVVDDHAAYVENNSVYQLLPLKDYVLAVLLGGQTVRKRVERRDSDRSEMLPVLAIRR